MNTAKSNHNDNLAGLAQLSQMPRSEGDGVSADDVLRVERERAVAERRAAEADAEADYHVGQKNSQGREIIAIENGKACVTDDTAHDYRFAASKRWYTLKSPILARIMAR